MGKKWIYGVAVSVLLGVVLAGCGDGSEEAGVLNNIDMVEPIDLGSETLPGTEGTEAGGEVTPGSVPEETAAPIPESGLSYSTGTLSAEAEAAVLETMKTLLQNLELPEYVGEGIHMVSSGEWFDTMTRELFEGGRNYVLRQGNALLSVQIGYDVEDEPYANIYYQAAEGDILVLKQAKDVTCLLQTKISDGKYDGAFDKWRIESKNGLILREQGTYAGGVMVGEYKKSEYTGSAGEVFDLWTNRENFTYKTTLVHYDENGQVTVTPAPTAETTNAPAQATNAPTQKPVQATKAPTQAPPQPTPEPPQAPETPQEPQPTPEPPQPTPEPPQPTPEPPQPTPEPPQPTPEPPQPTPEPPQEPSVGDTDIGWSPDLDV